MKYPENTKVGKKNVLKIIFGEIFFEFFLGFGMIFWNFFLGNEVGFFL
jgi:hypothetical protein